MHYHYFMPKYESPASHPSFLCISPRRSLLSSTTPHLPGEQLTVEMRVWHHIYPMATACAHPAPSLSLSTTPQSLQPCPLPRLLSSWLYFSSESLSSLPLSHSAPSFWEKTLYCYKMKEGAFRESIDVQVRV